MKAYYSIDKQKTKLQSIHVFVTNVLGPRGFLNLPILNLEDRKGPTGYIDFVKPQDMSAPLMRGVDKLDRPFIALRYVDSKGIVNPDEPKVRVVFHRYKNQDIIAAGTDCNPGLFGRSSILSKKNF